LTGIDLDKVEKYSITNQKITIEPSIHDTSSATLSLLIQQVNFLSASKIDDPFVPESPGFHLYLYQHCQGGERLFLVGSIPGRSRNGFGETPVFWKIQDIHHKY